MWWIRAGRTVLGRGGYLARIHREVGSTRQPTMIARRGVGFWYHKSGRSPVAPWMRLFLLRQVPDTSPGHPQQRNGEMAMGIPIGCASVILPGLRRTLVDATPTSLVTETCRCGWAGGRRGGSSGWHGCLGAVEVGLGRPAVLRGDSLASRDQTAAELQVPPHREPLTEPQPQAHRPTVPVFAHFYRASHHR